MGQRALVVWTGSHLPEMARSHNWNRNPTWVFASIAQRESRAPIEDMLAHSPPLPIVLEYGYNDSDMVTEDEEGLILALEQRSRTRRIRLRLSIPNLQKFITAIDEEFPILVLEYLIISSPGQGTALMLPETLLAPRLHKLSLIGFVAPNRSRLLVAAVGLITLFLSMVHPSTCFHPNDLLLCL